MDLHDFRDVAENYDKYINSLVGFSGFDNDTCVNFNLELARSYGQGGVLDMGCGTGLIMLPLLQDGFHVTGLDLSQEMVNQCSKKIAGQGIDADQYQLIQTSMADFDLQDKVSLALIPRSGFLHLLSTEDQISALQSINRNLVEGGHLSLNTFTPSYDIISERGHGKEEKPFYRTSFVNKSGNNVDIYNKMVYYHDTQLMKGEWTFEEKDEDGNSLAVVTRPVSMRWSFRSEMELLFRLTGFEVEKVYGGYDMSEISYLSQLIWVVKKVFDV